MAETRYIISDAARMINVEPHVLRYWEEELAIQIPRNELGHRYYTDKEIQLFENIRDLKEKGFQLKAIRLIISTLNEDAPFGKTGSEDEHMTEEEIAWYVSTKEPMDKAGAYGIQGLCARFVEKIQGDYNNVVGLPVGRIYQKLKKEESF